MDYKGFIGNEIADRVSQKGLHKALWNLFMFPITLLINYFNYRKWIRLLNHLGLTEVEFKEQIQITVIEEKVPIKNALKKYGESQAILEMNRCYLIEKDDLFIFPLYAPETINQFYTKIQEPIIIGLTQTRHPYETLWGVPTLTKVVELSSEGSTTTIKLKGELFENQIEFRINKNLRLATKSKLSP